MFVYGPVWAIVVGIVTVLVLLYSVAAVAAWIG